MFPVLCTNDAKITTLENCINIYSLKQLNTNRLNRVRGFGDLKWNCSIPRDLSFTF